MNKKNKLISGMLAALVGAALWVPAAHAIPFALDQLLGKASLGNSGEATELANMETFASNNNLFQDLKDNSPTAFSNAPGQWYIDVTAPGPGFFLLKFGTGGTGVSEDTYFFKNTGEMTKLVWSDAQVEFLSGGLRNTNIGRLSHFTTYNDPTPGPSQVPEPATLALLGLGLAAIGAARRRKK